MNSKNKPIRSKTDKMVIDGVTYIVTTHYNEQGRETAEQKLLRIVGELIAADLKKSGNAVI